MLVSSRRNYKPADPLADLLKRLPRGGAQSGPGSDDEAAAGAAGTQRDSDFVRGTQWVGIGRRKSDACVWDNRSSLNRTGGSGSGSGSGTGTGTGTGATRTRNATVSSVPLLTPSELLLPRHKTELEPDEFHYIANCYQKFYARKVPPSPLLLNTMSSLIRRPRRVDRRAPRLMIRIRHFRDCAGTGREAQVEQTTVRREPAASARVHTARQVPSGAIRVLTDLATVWAIRLIK